MASTTDERVDKWLNIIKRHKKSIILATYRTLWTGNRTLKAFSDHPICGLDDNLSLSFLYIFYDYTLFLQLLAAKNIRLYYITYKPWGTDTTLPSSDGQKLTKKLPTKSLTKFF